MVLGELLALTGIGTQLHVICDGAVGEEYMESATLCALDFTDPDFEHLLKEYGDHKIDTVSVKDNRLFIMLKHPSRG